MEDYAYILDFLPHGLPDDKRLKREPVAFGLGEERFKLFELTPKPNVTLTAGERVYIGKDLQRRKEILHVKRRVRYDDITNSAHGELPYVTLEIVKGREKTFVKFFNEARAITTRFHMLELLPGMGKKTMWAVLEERKKRPFESFNDIKERVPMLHHPEKIIARRIEQELMETDQKYHLFIAR